MSFPTDLPGCTSYTQVMHTQPVCARPESSGGTSSRHKRVFAAHSAKLRTLQHRYVRYGFLPMAILGALLVATVLPPARQMTPTTAVAAGYAVSGAVGGFVGDLPVMDEAARDGTDASDGTLIFGAPAAVPAAAPVVGTTTENNVRLRSGPSTRDKVIAKLPKGTKLEVLGQQSGWYRVATAMGTVGWVIDDFFTVATVPATGTARATGSTVSATVSRARVNLRKGPSTRYGSYGYIAAGMRVEVLGRNGDWYQVRSPRGTIGWIASRLLSVNANAVSNIPATTDGPALPAAAVNVPVQTTIAAAPVAPVASSSSTAARLALRYVGYRYVWGGSSPRGFDCSGLVQYVYRQLGVRLPRKASLQYSQTRGQRLRSLSSLAPGDLVFFVRTTRARGITHVGLYVGNGMMVTANSPRMGVQRVNVNGKYWRTRFAGGVRPYR